MSMSLKQRNPAITPQTFPQTQAPIVNNPLFWERLGSDAYGTDTLFFAFYYQQVQKNLNAPHFTYRCFYLPQPYGSCAVL